jgi:hypothetical protein
MSNFFSINFFYLSIKIIHVDFSHPTNLLSILSKAVRRTQVAFKDAKSKPREVIGKDPILWHNNAATPQQLQLPQLGLIHSFP